MQHWLFTPPEGVTGDIEMYIFFYHMRERWQDKYKYLKHMIGMRLKPNEKDEAFVNLPAGWAFLHYLIRPYRLLKEYSQATWQYITSGRRS